MHIAVEIDEAVHVRPLDARPAIVLDVTTIREHWHPEHHGEARVGDNELAVITTSSGGPRTMLSPLWLPMARYPRLRGASVFFGKALAGLSEPHRTTST